VNENHALCQQLTVSCPELDALVVSRTPLASRSRSKLTRGADRMAAREAASPHDRGRASYVERCCDRACPPAGAPTTLLADPPLSRRAAACRPRGWRCRSEDVRHRPRRTDAGDHAYRGVAEEGGGGTQEAGTAGVDDDTRVRPARDHRSAPSHDSLPPLWAGRRDLWHAECAWARVCRERTGMRHDVAYACVVCRSQVICLGRHTLHLADEKKNQES
jgi:hypothetical protein